MLSFHQIFMGGSTLTVVYPICCGVDVHKTFFVATIITTEGIVPKYQKRRFSTFNNQILLFKAWLLENDCRDVCMESTGKYWIPVFNLLEDSIRVTIANPKWVKTVKGNKDDAKDSKWIGDLFRIGLVPGSFIPGKDIRILREYTRYRVKLVSHKSSEKNRYQNVFTVCNVALDAVVSDMFGKSASSITDYIVNSDTFDPEHSVSVFKARSFVSGFSAQTVSPALIRSIGICPLAVNTVVPATKQFPPFFDSEYPAMVPVTPPTSVVDKTAPPLSASSFVDLELNTASAAARPNPTEVPINAPAAMVEAVVAAAQPPATEATANSAGAAPPAVTTTAAAAPAGRCCHRNNDASDRSPHPYASRPCRCCCMTS